MGRTSRGRGAWGVCAAALNADVGTCPTRNGRGTSLLRSFGRGTDRARRHDQNQGMGTRTTVLPDSEVDEVFDALFSPGFAQLAELTKLARALDVTNPRRRFEIEQGRRLFSELLAAPLRDRLRLSPPDAPLLASLVAALVALHQEVLALL